MSSNITTFNPQEATLLEMRADSKRFPRLNTIPAEQAYSQMLPIITQAFMFKGHNADDMTVKFIATNLVDELLADTKYGAGNISLGEIQKVIKRAILETDIPVISVSTLYKAILEYCKGEGKQLEQTIRQRRSALPPSPVQVMMDVQAAEMAKTHRIK